MIANVTLNERIRQRRQELGYGLRYVATLAGISPAFLVDIEAGARLPSADTLAKLAPVLNLPLADLQALDPRVTPEVKEWMDSDPGVSTMLARLYAHPRREAAMKAIDAALSELEK